MSADRTAPPPMIPGFTFVKNLGAGGFSSVYLFERHLPRRHVAVKVMNGDIGPDEIAAFESEANRMALLSSHPAILSVYEAGITEDGRPFIVMEYCPPPHLGSIIADGQMSVSDMLSTTIQIAGAVETAHRMSIIHRDIKPSNILLTSYHRPVLSDFGISALTGRNTAHDLRGMSVPWAPPEQLAGIAGAAPSVDVYSLGATAYAMLAGHSPFEVPGGLNGVYEVSRRIVSQPVPQIEREDVPPALFRILTIAMAKNPENRYDSALAFARALQQVEVELGLNVTPVDLLRGSDDLAFALSDSVDEDASTRIGVFKRVDLEAPPASTPPLTSAASAPTAKGEGARSGTAEVHRPAPGAEPSSEPPLHPIEAKSDKKKTNPIAWLSAAALLVAVAAVVVVSNYLWPHANSTTGDFHTSVAQPQDPFQTAVPEPRNVTGKLTGTSVEFTWEAPEANWAGSYLYNEELPGTPSESHPLDRTTVTVPKQPARTCIAIVAVREDGRSSDPVTACVDTP